MLFGFFVSGVLLTDRAELLKFKATLQLLFVLERTVVRGLTDRALEFDHVFLGHSGRGGGQKMGR